MKHYKVIILGSGPAGLTAAIYAARADLKPLVIAGYAAGGQLMITSEVENFPGFADAIMGPELMTNMRKQAERFGTEFIDRDATKVDFKKRPFEVESEGDKFTADAVIIATGASARWLDVPGESELKGKGVSACATCDGFFFRDKKVAVIGGGDSAVEEALFLTKFAKTVTVIHRRDELRASKIQADRAMANPKIDFIWNTVVDKINGEDSVKSLTVKNVDSEEQKDILFDGVFVAIGHTPNTGIFKGQLEMDSKGYLVLSGESRSSVDGVFVAGDVFDHRYRQAVTAAGSGCKAAIDAEKYLDH